MSRNREQDAEDCKAKGNEALSAKDYDKAIEWYNEAIKLSSNGPKSHVYFSNRSAAYLSKGFAESALKDGLECIKLDPSFAKGYSRKGAALHKLGKFDEAIEAYEEGLKVDPNNAGLKSGLEAATRAKMGPGGGMGGGANPLGALFGDNMMEKIKASPKLSKYLNDPTYTQMLNMIQANPQMLQFAAQDPRIQETFEEILGIKFQTQPSDSEEDIEKRKEEQAAREKKRKEEEEEKERKRKEEEERIRRENETPEEREKREKKEKAEEIKGRGNELYKKREFDEAIKLYEEAVELDPENITYLLNIASVKLEQGNLEECLSKCDDAIKVGRSVFAPYDQIAKAYERKGNAYLKQKMYAEAIAEYKNAQLESANPRVANRLKQAENAKKKAEKEAYLDPEKAKEAKEKGNELFKANKFPESIECYSEAIKRDPTQAAYYGNRAAAYMKLMDFGAAMDDIKKGLALDPKYVKLYARKGNIEFFLKEYHKSIRSYSQGLDIDPENAECQQGLAKTNYAIQTASANETPEQRQARAARAMEDKEIQNIMNDPVMRTVLEDMSKDPAKAQQHMQNPEIANNVQMLIAAGVISTR